MQDFEHRRLEVELKAVPLDADLNHDHVVYVIPGKQMPVNVKEW